MARILMCPPEFYGIEYEINPWMSRQRPSDRAVAQQQWENLRNILSNAGAEIHLQPAISGLPDLVFTANAALIFRGQAILARFKHEQRQGETPHDETWFRSAGFQTQHPPAGVFFEGAGDALFCGETLFAGYRMRSDARGHQQIGELLGVRVIPLELVNDYYYHLDTCFCPLAPDVAIYFPDAFDEYGRQALAAQVRELIPVTENEARRFACNAVVVGRTVVTNSGCPELHRTLAKRDFRPVETPLDEFVKSGGSAKCLTLRIDGEEAASWKYGSS